ncbi:MAG: lipopolysaccharide biosynthesis protein [Sandaracinus sp.]
MLEKLKQILVDTLTYGASGVMTQVLGFLLMPLYTRCLEAEEFGAIAMMSLVFQVFLALASLGFRTAMYKEFFAAKDEDERARAVGTAILGVGAASVGLLLLGQLLAPWLLALVLPGESRALLVRLELVTAAVSTCEGMLLLVLQAAREVRTAAAYTTGKALSFIVMNVALVAGVRWGVIGYLTAELTNALVSTAALLYLTRRFIVWSFVPIAFRRMLRYGLPFMPTRLLNIAMTLLGSFAVTQYLGLDDAGLFNVASRFASPISVILSAFSNTWSAYKFKVRAEDPDAPQFFARVTVYVTAAIGWLWVGEAAWGPEVLRLLTPAQYHSSAGLVGLIAAGVVPFGVGMMTGTGYELVEDTRRVPLVSVAGLAVSALAATTLVPRYGAIGAAVATLGANGVMHAGYWWIGRAAYPIPFRWGALAGLGAFAVAPVLVCGYAQTAATSARVVLAITVSVAYPVACAAVFRAAGLATDVRGLSSLWRRMRSGKRGASVPQADEAETR